MTLGIGHNDDHTLLIVVSFTGGPSSQGGDEPNGLVDVADGDVEMDPDLAHLWLGNRLEH